LGVSLVLGSPQARAQSEEEVAGARAAATEGIKAYNEGRYSAAVDLFQRAESLLHAPTHLLYMARANAKLGRLVAAREPYNKLIRKPLGPKAPPAFKNAQEAAKAEIAKVEPRIGKLTVTVQAPVGVIPVLKMDGVAFPSALVGVARPVDPGEHVLQASAEGLLVARQTVMVKEGGAAVLEPDPNANAAPASSEAPAPTPEATPGTPEADSGAAGGGGTSLAMPGYAALGVGVVGLGAGLLFTLQSAGKRSDADKAFARCQENGVDDPGAHSPPLPAPVRSSTSRTERRAVMTASARTECAVERMSRVQEEPVAMAAAAVEMLGRPARQVRVAAAQTDSAARTREPTSIANPKDAIAG
jgi:hypothetical protein